MFIKTVSTTSGINPIKFDETGGVFYWILNTGLSTIYASTKSTFTAGDDGVVSLGPKESRRLETNNDTIYILGEGQVEIHNQRDGICSFKQAPTSSGGGGTVDAYTKTESDAKYAQKTDIPTTLPANGGNADTVNSLKTDVPNYLDIFSTTLNSSHPCWNKKCSVYGQSNDINAEIYLANAPEINIALWYEVETIGNDARAYQIAHGCYSHQRKSFIRYMHDQVWSSWKNITEPIKSAHFAASTINGYIWTGIPFPKYVIGVDLGHFDVIAQFYKGNHVDAGRAEWTMMLFSKDDVTTPLNGSFNGVIYYID